MSGKVANNSMKETLEAITKDVVREVTRIDFDAAPLFGRLDACNLVEFASVNVSAIEAAMENTGTKATVASEKPLESCRAMR